MSTKSALGNSPRRSVSISCGGPRASILSGYIDCLKIDDSVLRQANALVRV